MNPSRVSRTAHASSAADKPVDPCRYPTTGWRPCPRGRITATSWVRPSGRSTRSHRAAGAATPNGVAIGATRRPSTAFGGSTPSVVVVTGAAVVGATRGRVECDAALPRVELSVHPSATTASTAAIEMTLRNRGQSEVRARYLRNDAGTAITRISAQYRNAAIWA